MEEECHGVSRSPQSQWHEDLKRARNGPTANNPSDSAGSSLQNGGWRALVAWEEPAANSLKVFVPLLGARGALTH